jgi:hypothetical protein
MKTKIIIMLLFIALFCQSGSAVQVDEGVIFQPLGYDTIYYMNDTFNFSTVGVSSTSLTLDNGSITCIPISNPVNFTLEAKENIYFTTNDSASMSITSGFVNETISGILANLKLQSDNSIYSESLIKYESITFTFIPANSYFIEIADLLPPVWGGNEPVDLWIKLGAMIILGAVVFIVGIVIAATRFDRPDMMKELVAIGLGALILVVLFGVITMVGSTFSGL